jgi:hypothetical protein
MLCSPTIRAALIAGMPWLDVYCPGCGTSHAIDLRKVDRHPLASIGTLVLELGTRRWRKSLCLAFSAFFVECPHLFKFALNLRSFRFCEGWIWVRV